MFLFQPAGYRVVNHENGAVSVAMDMRFTHHRTPADSTRYGRFSDEILTVMVTVEPGSTLVKWHQRKDNPNPLPRADRFWNLACFPQERIGTEIEVVKKGKVRKKMQYDKEAMRAKTIMLFPMNWVVDHGPTTVHTSPHWSNHANWSVSHFAVDRAAPFVGAYYPEENISRVRIDPDEPRIAAKLYSDYWCTMVEQWGGIGDVFEHPGELRPGHAPVQFTQGYWITQGIGQVDWADSQVALNFDAGELALLTPREHQAKVMTADGTVLLEGPVGPHTPLRGPANEGAIVIELDGTVVLEQQFPLQRPEPVKETETPAEIQAVFTKLAGPNPYRIESESFGADEGTPNAMHAERRIQKITAESDPVEALSLARAAYRVGVLDEAQRVATLFPGPEADLILGLLALEAGKSSDFGQAGWQADWQRALSQRAAGNTDAAIVLVQQYLAQVPDAWYPRLAQAYWQQDLAQAKRLADENPASPEAQLIIKLLGGKPDFAQLLHNNPSVNQQLKRFQVMVEDGSWAPMVRYTDKL